MNDYIWLAIGWVVAGLLCFYQCQAAWEADTIWYANRNLRPMRRKVFGNRGDWVICVIFGPVLFPLMLMDNCRHHGEWVEEEEKNLIIAEFIKHSECKIQRVSQGSPDYWCVEPVNALDTNCK